MSKIVLANEISLPLFKKAVVGDERVSERNVVEYFRIVKSNIYIERQENLKTLELKDVIEEVKKYVVRKDDIVKTFYRDLSEVLRKSRIELALDQIMHYITTYGTDFETEMYHKNEWLNIPEVKDTFEKIVVVPSITQSEFNKELVNLLESNIALSEDLIEKIILYIDAEKININLKNVRNKEFLRAYKYKRGIIEDIDDIITFIHKESLGNFLSIKTKTLFNEDGYMWLTIPDSVINHIRNLTKDQLVEYAKSFNRNKSVWMTLKREIEDRKCRRNINKISKLSKIHHQPVKLPDYMRIADLSIVEFDNVVRNLEFGYLVKIARYLKMRINAESDEFPLIIRVRNGKSYVKNVKVGVKSDLQRKFDFVKVEISRRVVNYFVKNNVKIKESDKFALAIPVNEKQFVGEFPVGSSLTTPDRNLVFGISWRGRADFDLSAVNDNRKVGWNGYFNTDELFFSGDITDAPNGATELIFTKNATKEFLIKVNLFNRRDNTKGFKFFIGTTERYLPQKKKQFYQRNIEEILTPDEIVFAHYFEVDGNKNERTMGFLENNKFYFVDFLANEFVAGVSSKETMEAYKHYVKGFLTFNEILSANDISNINHIVEENAKKAQEKGEQIEVKELDFENPDKIILLNLLKENNEA